jgi:hypothetical protein
LYLLVISIHTHVNLSEAVSHGLADEAVAYQTRTLPGRNLFQHGESEALLQTYERLHGNGGEHASCKCVKVLTHKLATLPETVTPVPHVVHKDPLCVSLGCLLYSVLGVAHTFLPQF